MEHHPANMNNSGTGRKEKDVDGSDWNFDADLELLRQKIKQSSSCEKEEIRKWIQQQVANVNDNTTAFTEGTSNGNTGSVVAKDAEVLQQNVKRVTRSKAKELCNVEEEPPIFETTSKALGIDLILLEIMSYLPRAKLLECRFVNKTWNRNAVSKFCENTEYVCNITDMKKFCTEIDQILPRTIFKRIEVSLAENDSEDCIKFFAMVGTHVKDLSIKEDDGRDEQVQMKCSPLVYILRLRHVLLNIPEVETLSLWRIPTPVISMPFVLTDAELEANRNLLQNVKTLMMELRDASADFTEKFFSMVPNVRVLELAYQQTTNDYGALATAMSKLNLTEIKNYNHAWPAVEFWSRMKHQRLKVLQIELVRLDNDNEIPAALTELQVTALQEFFESQSETLQKLHLYAYEDPEVELKIHLPVMHNLQELQIRFRGDLFDLFEPSQLPKLSSLGLCATECIEAFSSNEFLSVQKLYFVSAEMDNYPSQQLIAQIDDLFPNLRHLQSDCLEFTDESLRALFSIRNLESLQLLITEENLEKDYFKDILCGFPPGSSWLTSQLVGSNAPKIKPPQPAFWNMQSLKRLALVFKKSLELDPADLDFEIDEAGVQLGLLLLPRLEFLELCGDVSISEAGIAALCAYHSCVSVIHT